MIKLPGGTEIDSTNKNVPMQHKTKILILLSATVFLILAWAPWITDEHAKNIVLHRICSSIYQRNGDEVCILSSNFLGGGWQGMGMQVKDVAAAVIWVPFGRYVTNFEGMFFVPFYSWQRTSKPPQSVVENIRVSGTTSDQSSMNTPITKNHASQPVAERPEVPATVISDQQTVITVTIVAPENKEVYRERMTQFVQAGGENPLQTLKFIQIEKEIITPYANNILRASAQAAAEEFSPSGGPQKASVEYLNVKNGTAYVLLNIDLSGWAGVSVWQAIIHPLVEKTLLLFPEINRVVFDYAPEDKTNSDARVR